MANLKAESEPNTKNPGRLAEPDMLRSLAFLGVVAQHILGAWARRPNLGPRSMALIALCFELVRFAVPMFVFLFGLMLSRKAFSKYNTSDYYRRRAWQLVVPYVLWSAWYVCSAEEGMGVEALPGLLLRGGAEYHLWYVPMILQFVILAPLLLKLIRRIRTSRHPAAGWLTWMAAGIVWLIFLAKAGAMRESAAAAFIFRHQTQIFLSWMLYFTAGAWAGSAYKRFCAFAKKAFLLCLIISVAAIAWVMREDLRFIQENNAVSFNQTGLQRLPYALAVLAMILCLQGVAMVLGKSRLLRAAASWISAHSYRAYLCHPAVIRSVNKRLVARFTYLPAYYLLLYALTVAFSLAIAFALDLAYGRLRRRR